MDSKNQVLVKGALGQLGTELVAALRRQHGPEKVIPTDGLPGSEVPLNVLDAGVCRI